MKKFFPTYIRVLLIFFIVFGLMEYFIDSGDQPAFIRYPMVSLFLFVFLFVLIAVEITMSAVNRVMYQLMSPEEKAKLAYEESLSLTETAWYKDLMHRFTKIEPIEKEGELLMDHDYDGIKELDNNLPPWWVYLFYICIVFGVVYVPYYEFYGDDQETELKIKMAEAKIEVEEYLKTAPDLMDEKTVVLLTDAPSLAEGKEIYTTNCVACHRADGGGQIGPNLTDDHWILGGGIKNVFHTVTNGGRDGKGMVSWKTNGLKPKEIQKVSSYILSLQGSNPKEPKAPEGDVWVDETAPKNEKTTNKSTDSTAVKK